MPVWRCPHCATPQAETSRCWVCRRSTTSCATCRHFRRGVAGGLGLCGLEPRRLALQGTEMRACWTGAPQRTPEDDGRRAVPVGPGAQAERVAGGVSAGGLMTPGGNVRSGVIGTGRRPRTFVPIETLEAAAAEADEPSHVPVMLAPSPVTRVPGTWWLWGDPEPWPEP
jgi:hypothetical protein